MDSGLSWLSEDFGFSATLFRVSREMNIEPDKLCNDYSVTEFYHMSRFLAWEKHAESEYQKIMSLKNRVS